MIVVLDYGIGNLRSAEKALTACGADARLVTRPEEAAGADAVVLPGVGAFGAAATALRASGLDAVVHEALDAGLPFLGICVGYQLLFEGSEESPAVDGLGVLSGRVRRLDGDVKLPQIQWNTVRTERDSALLGPAGGEHWYYFVHAYAPVPAGDSTAAVVGTAEYGERFAAAVERENLFGVQFHPEKSGGEGLALLGRFVALATGASSGASRLAG